MKEEKLLDGALDRARKETDTGLDAMRARVVLRRIEEELGAPPPRRWLVPTFALASAAVGALAVFVVMKTGTPVIVEQPPQIARVVYQSGNASSEKTELEPLAKLDVAKDERLDFVVPKKVRVAVHGPASVARVADGSITLASGRASFSVDPHPKTAPFKVHARGADIVVHGTKFDVDVKDGALAQVRVVEGKVEVRPADGKPSVFLTGGAKLREEAATSSSAAATFSAPWWKGRHDEDAGEGYLHVTSRPAGARVTLDGEPIGVTPVLVLWPHGERELGVTHAGYRAHAAKIAIDPAKMERVAVELVALPSREETPAKKSSKHDPWKIAAALLDAKKCAQLDRVVEGIVEHAANDADKARAELLGAECRLRTGAKSRALASFRRIAESYAATQSAEAALFEAAKLEGELGNPNESLQELERYLSRHPSGRFAEAATIRRCEVMVELKRLGEARGCLENFRRVFPAAIRGPEAVLLLATIARVEARWPAAVELYGEYLALAPSSARAEDAAYQRIACMRRGKIAGVEDAIADFMKRWPNSAKAGEIKK